MTRFIPPMLCERLTNLSRLADRGYIAEPKLDGQRAQLHVHKGRAVACFSRRGLDLLEHPGMLWLRDIAWPFESAIFDGEACAGDGKMRQTLAFVAPNALSGCDESSWEQAARIGPSPLISPSNPIPG